MLPANWSSWAGIRSIARVVTDNGNIILDLHNLRIDVPREMEQRINNITGVVWTVLAQRPADLLLLATDEGVKRYRAAAAMVR